MRLPWPISPDPIALRAPVWLSSISARIEEGGIGLIRVAEKLEGNKAFAEAQERQDALATQRLVQDALFGHIDD